MVQKKKISLFRSVMFPHNQDLHSVSAETFFFFSPLTSSCPGGQWGLQ